MASKNKLLGHGQAEKKETIVEEPDGALKLYRKDFPQGRVFPPDMIAMMKRKGWGETPIQLPKSKIDVARETEEDED
jgi:hypothetical protein